MDVLLVNCSLIDSLSPGVQAGAHVWISGDRIRQIVQSDPAQMIRDFGSQVKVLDLHGRYVIPGLWDCHTHPGGLVPDPTGETLYEREGWRALRGLRNAQDALRVGFTSLRVVGEAAYVDVALKRAFAEGLLVGPRLTVCGHMLRCTGGHGACGDAEPRFTPDYIEADGPHEFAKAARLQLKMGADQIKIAISGGIAGVREGTDEPQMSEEEMRAVTDVAHRKGVRVCAHAGSARAIKQAVRAGVDCIEHGYHLDREAARMMADHGTYYVPTLSVTQDEEYMERHRWPRHMKERVRRAAEAHLESFRMAVEEGVRIASGADLNPICETAPGEVIQLVRAGLTPWEALVAATKTAAELCGLSDRLGTLQEGKLADLVVLAENPLEDIANIRTVELVLFEGRIVWCSQSWVVRGQVHCP